MFVSKKAGRRRVSVIATISTYLQRATCFTDWWNIIMSESWRKQPWSRIQIRLFHFLQLLGILTRLHHHIVSFPLIPSALKLFVKQSEMLMIFSVLWSRSCWILSQIAVLCKLCWLVTRIISTFHHIRIF